MVNVLYVGKNTHIKVLGMAMMIVVMFIYVLIPALGFTTLVLLYGRVYVTHVLVFLQVHIIYILHTELCVCLLYKELWTRL